MDNNKSNKPIIIIDTREQLPYQFSNQVVSERAKLFYGDYSVKNFETTIVLERKSLDDLVNTISPARGNRKRCDRFFLQLIAMRDNYKSRIVVVEGLPQDIVNHKYTAKVNPKTILTIVEKITNYYVPVHFAGRREFACKFVEEWLLNEWIKHVKDDFIK